MVLGSYNNTLGNCETGIPKCHSCADFEELKLRSTETLHVLEAAILLGRGKKNNNKGKTENAYHTVIILGSFREMSSI